MQKGGFIFHQDGFVLRMVEFLLKYGVFFKRKKLNLFARAMGFATKKKKVLFRRKY